jgi:plastocyanin
MRALLALTLFALAAGCLSGGTTPTPAANNSTATAAPMSQMIASVELGESPAAPGAPPVGPGSMYLKATGMDALMVGVPVNLTIKNAGSITHDLVIDGLGFKSGDIAGGQSKSFTFTPTKDGTFDMYCDKAPAPDPTGMNTGSHRADGMAGKVTVKKAA